MVSWEARAVESRRGFAGFACEHCRGGTVCYRVFVCGAGGRSPVLEAGDLDVKTLWAPWRREYILGEKNKACIFCEGLSEKARYTLFTGSLTLVMMNRYPYTNGHLLVAPSRHVATLEALTDEEMGDLMKTVRDAVRILSTVMHPDGFNVGVNLGEVAGAGVAEHLHVHVVPRWQGDTNMMTVCGEVRVVCEGLQDTHDRLSPHFAALEHGPIARQ